MKAHEPNGEILTLAPFSLYPTATATHAAAASSSSSTPVSSQPKSDEDRSHEAFINADDIDDVSLVDNTTTVAVIVLQQVIRQFTDGRFLKNDVVIMFNCVFQAVKKSIGAYDDPAGGSVVEVQLPFPIHAVAFFSSRDLATTIAPLLLAIVVLLLLLLCCGCGDACCCGDGGGGGDAVGDGGGGGEVTDDNCMMFWMIT
ncbi:hypothetical protein PIB30_074596 [Stylosanthes scabra]|uniref:Uncharacterized protein n=1 Tax=Stylosanthes scabra TaxID=79078 RepID=A0ABU6QPQ2_9FABA|nr:hypothetical protein [Stylosanthes scabra]